MASSEFENQKEKVESSFRRFGIEGETAFHALAYHYTVYQSGQVKKPTYHNPSKMANSISKN